MKVNVIQVNQATFKSRWRWWSNWIDVAVFNYDYTSFLLQMRVSRLNRKAFKTTRMTGRFTYRRVSVSEIGDLESMSR